MKKFWSLLLISLFILSGAVNTSFAYQMERPNRTIENIGQRDENATVDDEAAVGIGVHVATYRENPDPTEGPYYGRDGVCFRVIATANTRKGIEYDYSIVPISPYWVEATEPTNIIGDDSGAWIDIPFGVTFYGGPGVQNTSAVYNKVWVSSNGFLSFDNNSNSYTPTPVPSPTLPNALIAAYWSDLDPTGGSITYYADLNKFVVEWKNVLAKYNGLRQTFEVVILNDYYPIFRGQNRFFLLYQTVTWPGQSSSSETSPSSPPPEPTIYVVQGIEDQEGYKGTEPPFVDSGYGIQFTAKPFSSPEIRELDILMNKNDAYAQVYVSTERWNIRGENIQYETPEPDPSDPPLLGTAVAGGLTLLISSAIGLAYGPVAGLMFGATRVTMELGYEYAKQLWEADPIDIRDEYSHPGTDFCYVNASAAANSPPYDYPVDASVGTQIFWIFLDDNNLDHELTLTAQLKYYSHIQEKIVTLKTSVTLEVYGWPPPVQEHRYWVMGGTMDTAGNLGAFLSWPLEGWKTNNGVPFHTRKPYLTPVFMTHNITFSDPQEVLGYGLVVYLTVPSETYVGLEHVWYEEDLSVWCRFRVTMENDGYGWLFLNGTGDVDYCTFSNYAGVYWGRKNATFASPLEGQQAASQGQLPSVGSDGIPGTLDDGFGDGTPDPAGSSILYLPTTVNCEYWDPNNEVWKPFYEVSWPQVMTTGTAYNIVNESLSPINCVNSTQTGQPWEFLAGKDHPGWKVSWEHPKSNAYVTYACVWSVLRTGSPFGPLDILFVAVEKLMRQDCVIADITGDEKVTITDIVNGGNAFGAKDESPGKDGKPGTGDDHPVADSNYDARADFAAPRGEITMTDIVNISIDFGAYLSPNCVIRP